MNHNWENTIKLILSQFADYDDENRERKKNLISFLFEEGEPSSQKCAEAVSLLSPKDRLEKIILLSL